MVTLNHPAQNSSNWYQAMTSNWDTIETSLLDQNLVTAKGDLIVAPGPSAFSRIGVGSNNQALMADSTQAVGMRWASVHTTGLVAVSSVSATTADSTTSTTFVALNSMSLSVSVTSPQKVLVFFNANFQGSTGRFAILQLLRGTQVLHTVSVGGHYGTWNDVGTLMSMDQPGTGSVTYSVQWMIGGGAGTINQDLQPFSASGDRVLTAISLPA